MRIRGISLISMPSKGRYTFIVFKPLSQHQTASFGLRNGITKLFCRVKPQLNGLIGVSKSQFRGIPMCHTT